MSRGKPQSFWGRWSPGRLVAIWAAGLLGAFALGLYLFSPPPEPDTKMTGTDAAPTQPLPAELAVSGAKPSVDP